MKTTLVQIGPSVRASEAGRVTLCPEMNAAVAARHSRTQDGLEGILSKIDLANGEDKAIDSVFQFVDFGHRSIVDMVPASIHIEGISLWLAEFIWGLVHTGGGQETSTRYCKMSADEVFIPMDTNDHLKWAIQEQVNNSMLAYQKACKFWSDVAVASPGLVGITEDTDAKKAERFRRNFVFDRARYFIPMVCLTNMNVTTWGTEWIRIVQALISSPWKEAKDVGESLLREIEIGSPRIVRHASRFSLAWSRELCGRVTDCLRPKIFGDKTRKSIELFGFINDGDPVERVISLVASNNVAPASLAVGVDDHGPAMLKDMDCLSRCLGERNNRYDIVGSPISSIPVQYGWRGVANAEIRDMNRHRPGIRTLGLRPEGFYFAEDQILLALQSNPGNEVMRENAEDLVKTGVQIGLQTLKLSMDILSDEEGHLIYNVVYATNLGNTFSFSHSNTLGHLIYECELRTGAGTHFRYRAHYKDLLKKLYEDFPLMKQFMLEGSGEPE